MTTASAWARPTFPVAPVAPDDVASLEVVEEALLTRVARGPLRVPRRTDRWIRGVVHRADGRLVRSSQKVGGLGGNQWVAADPGRVPVRDEVERLSGTWVYGGHWIDHFGHFVTETLTTLWHRDVPADAGLVFHQYLARDRGVQPWQERLLALAGWGGRPVRVVHQRPRRVERLVVPSRTVVANGWALPEAREVWQRIASPYRRPASDRVFLSRTGFHETQRATGLPTRTSPEQDHDLDRAMEAAGLEVVRPEELPVEEQLHTVAGARLLVGRSGSALHLSAFAPPAPG